MLCNYNEHLCFFLLCLVSLCQTWKKFVWIIHYFQVKLIWSQNNLLENLFNTLLFVNVCHILMAILDCLTRLYNKLVSVSLCVYICMFLCGSFACKCEAQIYFLAAWLRQKAWEVIFIEVLLVGLLWETFSMAERRVTTQWGCLSATHTCVCLLHACTSLRTQAPFHWALLRGLPGVCFASCFVSESPPPCCGSVAGSSGSSPPVLRQCH